MIKEEMLSKVMEIASRTMGFDIKPLESQPIKELPKEPKHPKDEHWSLVFDMLSCEYKWKKDELDKDLEYWDVPRTEVNLNDFTQEQIDILIDHNFLAKETMSFHNELETWMRGRNLHIKTDERSWMTLCGRHWRFNLDTNEVNLISMN